MPGRIGTVEEYRRFTPAKIVHHLNSSNTDESCNVYFPDRIQGTSRDSYTQNLRDLISTSYFGDMCRHIHSGYQMFPVNSKRQHFARKLENPIFMSACSFKKLLKSSFKFTKSNRFCTAMLFFTNTDIIFWPRHNSS